ncbi:MAG: ABC transporter substrate-binding protein [Vicinamibacteraceae bacterium]|nr:ABC transporter substrate-binding protein [Vicinamibacteraceae bacterium]
MIPPRHTRYASAWLLVSALVVGAGLVVLWRGTSSRPAVTHPRRLTAMVRSEPRGFNRLVSRDRTSVTLTHLLHGRLVRVNLETQDVEPALAESWTVSDDGRTWRLALRQDVRWSDGTPFTADDVRFTFEAVFDPRVKSPLAGALRFDGKPLGVAVEDDGRVVRIDFPVPYGPGLRVLDSVPILPRHKLGDALARGTLASAWPVTTAPADIVGLGPFVLKEYRPGDRVVLGRNPYFWKRDPAGRALPYLDELVILVVPDQNAEMLRLESGEADLMVAEVRPDDLAAVRDMAERERVRLVDLGVGLDPDFLWFNLAPSFARREPARAWIQLPAVRRALNTGVDRQALVSGVYFGAGVPVYGPVTPANRAWYDPDAVPPVAHDVEAARRLLEEAGFTDADGDGRYEAPGGGPARFALLTQKGNTLRERAAEILQDEAAKIGLGVDVVALEQPALIERITTGQFEAVYFGFQQSDTDPAVSLDFWLPSGAFHAWHASQNTPATPWEAEIDRLMLEMVAAPSAGERQRLFSDVQRIVAREVPALWFVAPRVYVATSPWVIGARPSVLQPMILWNAEGLDVRRD